MCILENQVWDDLMFSGRINTCRPEQRFSMCCTNISLTLINLTLRDRLWKFLINNFIESSPFLPPREIPDVRMQLESWGHIEKKIAIKK